MKLKQKAMFHEYLYICDKNTPAILDKFITVFYVSNKDNSKIASQINS